MKINIVSRKNKKNIGYMKTGSFRHYCNIFIRYQDHPELIKNIQKVFLENYDLVEESRSRINSHGKRAGRKPHFNKLLDGKVKVRAWDNKFSAFVLVEIGKIKKIKKGD